MPPQPDISDQMTHEKWLLHLAFIQSVVNNHDWKHRGSYFKRGEKDCRYNMPRAPVNDTCVRLLMEEQESNRNTVKNVTKLAFDIRRHHS